MVQFIYNSQILDNMADNTPQNTTTKPDPIIGMEISGCKVTERLGSGGMGSAYKAHHPGLDKWVCIKILSPEFAGDERYVQFFLREARSVAKLEHPNIVQVFNIGQEKDIHYIVMSYIEGRSLSEIIKEKGKLDFDTAVKITTGILSGLAHAHSKEIIHRDIKPSNILITSDWEPKIIDFGLARQVNEEKQLTMVGEMVGTAYLMPPEQGLGRKVDHRADLYSTGVTFFYMLTGRYPFEGKTSIEVIHKHISEPPPNIIQIAPDVPLWAAAIVERFLKKKPEERFQTADEAIEAFSKGAAYRHPIKPVGGHNAGSIDLSGTETTLKIAPPGASFATKEEVAQISKRVPGVISFDEVMAEQMQALDSKSDKKPASENQAKPGQAQSTANAPAPLQQPQVRFAVPPPPPAQSENAARSGNSLTKQAEPLVLEDDESRKESLFQPKDYGYMALYAACLLGIYVFSMTTGIVCAAKTTPASVEGWGYFKDPWLVGAFLPHQLVLAGVALVLLGIAAVLGIASFFSGTTVMLIAMAASAYMGGITWPDATAGIRLTNKLLNLVYSAAGHVFSDTSMLIAAGIAFFGGTYLLSRSDNGLPGRITGSLLAAAMPALLWYYCSNSGQYAGADAIFVFVSITAAAMAIGVGFMKKNSILPLLGPFLLLGASILSMWYYSVSGLTSSFIEKAEAQQTQLIKETEDKNNALIADYERTKAEMHRAALAESRQKAAEVPLISGDGPAEPRREAKPEIRLERPKLFDVPKPKPQEEIYSEARKMALREPFSRFQDKAGTNSAYVLLALVLSLMTMGLFINDCAEAVRSKYR